MRLLKIILVFAFTIPFFSCEKRLSALQFEKNVLNEVFLEIVDSIYMDRRIMLPPPLLRFDSKTNKHDTLGYNQELQKYKHRQDSIRKDTAKIVIAVHDFVTKITKEDKIIIRNIFKDSINYDTSKDVKQFKINLSTFSSKSAKVTFKYASEVIPDRFWIDSNKALPVGSVSVSRIQFSKNKSSATLTAGASCGGGKCGRGFIIIIVNKSGRWKIAKIIQTWVS